MHMKLPLLRMSSPVILMLANHHASVDNYTEATYLYRTALVTEAVDRYNAGHGENEFRETITCAFDGEPEAVADMARELIDKL
jgi:hypothetical protein